MPPKSKIELSPHFNEIVDLLLAGNSGRYVSDYLLNEYGEKISHTSLNKYKRNKLNVKAAAKKQIIEKEKQKLIKKNKKREVTKEAKKELSIEASAAPITKNYGRAEDFLNATNDIDLISELNEYKKSPDYDEVKYLDLLVKVEKIRLDYMKYQSDLFEENTLDVNVNSNFDDLFNEEDILRFIDESDYITESDK